MLHVRPGHKRHVIPIVKRGKPSGWFCWKDFIFHRNDVLSWCCARVNVTLASLLTIPLCNCYLHNALQTLVAETSHSNNGLVAIGTGSVASGSLALIKINDCYPCQACRGGCGLIYIIKGFGKVYLQTIWVSAIFWHEDGHQAVQWWQNKLLMLLLLLPKAFDIFYCWPIDI